MLEVASFAELHRDVQDLYGLACLAYEGFLLLLVVLEDLVVLLLLILVLVHFAEALPSFLLVV